MFYYLLLHNLYNCWWQSEMSFSRGISDFLTISQRWNLPLALFCSRSLLIFPKIFLLFALRLQQQLIGTLDTVCLLHLLVIQGNWDVERHITTEQTVAKFWNSLWKKLFIYYRSEKKKNRILFIRGKVICCQITYDDSMNMWLPKCF